MAKPRKSLQDLLATAKDQSARQTSGGGKKAVTPAIGDYQESTGGGTPMKKGQHIDKIADTAEEAQQYRKNNPGAVVRVNQPRDTDGQFTYNSANKKTLEYKSRGETIPPFLRGVKLTFAKKSGKGAIVDASGKKFSLSDAIRSEKDFINAFKEFREDEENFAGIGSLSGVMKGKGGKTGLTITIGLFQSDYQRMKSASLPGKPNFAVRDTSVKRNTTKAPKDTTPNTPQATDDTNASSDGVDYSVAKTDPEKFMTDNYDELQNIIDMADNAGYDVTVDDIVTEIANGNIKDFDYLKDLFKG